MKFRVEMPLVVPVVFVYPVHLLCQGSAFGCDCSRNVVVEQDEMARGEGTVATI
jgi:hypothetical protein